jgi:Putative transposase/Transposase zinc-binding domain
MDDLNLLKQILEATRDLWDRPETRADVRKNFHKMLECRTAALGAEVYASDTGEKRFYHTCKSRCCPSCGYRATLLWQEEQKAILPEVRYAGIVFTMPRPLWRIFQDNRHLLHDLPVLGAGVIQQWAAIKYGVCPLILVMPHTFGGDLKFNSHLHILVSAGGLQERSGKWLPGIQFNKRALMRLWRDAVIAHLRRALKAHILKSVLDVRRLEQLLTKESERPFWVIYIDPIVSKSHFAGYAGRYVRRLPIALRRLSKVTEREVTFLTKDAKAKQSIPRRYSLWSFVALLAEHVPDHYRHGIRYFGLLSPRVKARTWLGLFLLLNQHKRPRPRRLSWRSSLRRYFGVDPIICRDVEMGWLRREKPVTQ